MKRLFDVRIGDIEGNNQYHRFYIELEEDEYDLEMSYRLPIYHLTQKGVDNYKHLWETNYGNYSIVPVTNDQVKSLMIELEDEIDSLNRALAELHNYYRE